MPFAFMVVCFIILISACLISFSYRCSREGFVSKEQITNEIMNVAPIISKLTYNGFKSKVSNADQVLYNDVKKLDAANKLTKDTVAQII